MASSARKVIDTIVEFIEVKAEQIKLRIITRVAKLLSGVIAFSMVAILGFFCLFFLSFALAVILNSTLNSPYLGYLIIAGAYLLVIIIILTLVKKRVIQRWIESAIVKLEEAKYGKKD